MFKTSNQIRNKIEGGMMKFIKYWMLVNYICHLTILVLPYIIMKVDDQHMAEGSVVNKAAEIDAGFSWDPFWTTVVIIGLTLIYSLIFEALLVCCIMHRNGFETTASCYLMVKIFTGFMRKVTHAF